MFNLFPDIEKQEMVSCEYRHEMFGWTQYWDLHEWLNKCWLLGKDSAPCSKSVNVKLTATYEIFYQIKTFIIILRPTVVVQY
jgi:hypothetical protein